MPDIDLSFSAVQIASNMETASSSQQKKRFIQHDPLEEWRLLNMPLIKKRRLFGSSRNNLFKSNNKNLDSDDCDLTNLNWLQDFNLLKKFYSSTLDPNNKGVIDIACMAKSGPVTQDCVHKVSLVLSSLNPCSIRPVKSQNYQHRKPPYSYSALIFMAIESSEEKSMMVRDIYKWIINNFPYFATAPSGKHHLFFSLSKFS